MGGYIRSEIERSATKQINTQIDKNIADNFKGYCKSNGYPLNLIIETFMQDFVNKEFLIKTEKVKKWGKDSSNKMTVNTTVDLQTYKMFKEYCHTLGYGVGAVLAVFMKQFVEEEYVVTFKHR